MDTLASSPTSPSSSLIVSLIVPNAHVHTLLTLAPDLFPIKLSSFLNRVWHTDRDMAKLIERFESSSLGLMDPIRLVKAAIPGDVSMKVTEIVPRLKDGGAFVKFRHDASLDPFQAEGDTTNPVMSYHQLTSFQKPSSPSYMIIH